MQIQYGIQKIMRSKAITIAVTLLLSSAIVIGNFGWIAYMVTRQQVEAIDSAYSALASPSKSYSVEYNRQTSSWQLLYDSEGTTVQQEYSADGFDAVVADPEIVASKSKGRAVGGIAHDLIIPSKYDPNGSIMLESSEVRYAVFLITCTSQPTYENNEMSFSASVDDILSIHPDYPVPDELTVSLEEIGLDEDGNSLVQLGEQYVVWGVYATTTYLYGVGSAKDYHEDVTKRFIVCSALRTYGDMTSQYFENGLLRWKMPDVDYPEILRPSDEKVSKLTSLVKELREIVPVYGLGEAGLNGLMSFHTGLYYLTDGRDFTIDELRQGSAVCVISKQLAERNGLQVGSTISLSMFDTGALYSVNSRTDAVMFSMDTMPDACSRSTGEYTVIGVYSGPAAQEHIDNVPMHTIFVPEAVLPSGTIPAQKIKTNMGFTMTIPEKPIGNSLPVLQTFVLRKNQTASFMQAMKELGMDHLYTVHDNGYSRIAELLKCMQSDAQILLIVCVSVEILLLLCVLCFYTMQRRHEHGRLIQLGATRRWVGGYYAVGLCLISLCALLLGNGVSMLMNSRFIELMNEYSLLSLNVFARSVQQNVSNVQLPASDQMAIFVMNACVLLILDGVMTGIGCAFRSNSMLRRRNMV